MIRSLRAAAGRSVAPKPPGDDRGAAVPPSSTGRAARGPRIYRPQGRYAQSQGHRTQGLGHGEARTGSPDNPGARRVRISRDVLIRSWRALRGSIPLIIRRSWVRAPPAPLRVHLSLKVRNVRAGKGRLHPTRHVSAHGRPAVPPGATFPPRGPICSAIATAVQTATCQRASPRCGASTRERPRAGVSARPGACRSPSPGARSGRAVRVATRPPGRGH